MEIVGSEDMRCRVAWVLVEASLSGDVAFYHVVLGLRFGRGDGSDRTRVVFAIEYAVFAKIDGSLVGAGRGFERE